ncbi:MAG: hypothetical protein SWI22_15015 [Pseudomonadota bacterium]|nr:hypothetical protein [Pseudomonadota bacterium]
MLLTVVFGERSDLSDLAKQGALWAEDLSANRTQIEAIWNAGGAATLFKTKGLQDVVIDADLHEPAWRELRVLRTNP